MFKRRSQASENVPMPGLEPALSVLCTDVLPNKSYGRTPSLDLLTNTF